MSIAALVEGRRILVCCGSGGVGKTTTAAVLALEGARRGRRAVVVTIDPAKRLADALGMESLSNTAHQIEGDWSGELWALMLDTKSTFDALVAKYSASSEQAQGILDNRFYRNIAGALSGTQEYMAMEKLYELNDEDRFDLIVVDTPPTRNALDFLDAPRRLTRMLDNRIFRWLMMPTHAYLRAVSVATQAFLRTISRVVGSEVIQDVVNFFHAFEGMEEGFRGRAQEVLQLLGDERTAFILVTSPRRDAVEEGVFFAEKLTEAGLDVEALIVNRIHPRFGDGMAETDHQRASTLGDTDLARLYANRADFRQIADGEERHMETLAKRVAPAPVVRVPFLDSDVHDVEGLGEVARYLLGTETPVS